MNERIDPPKNQGDVFAALLAVLFMVIAAVIWYLWSHYRENITLSALDSASLLRYVHYPVMWMYSNEWQQLIRNLPALAAGIDATTTTPQQLHLISQISSRAFHILFCLIAVPYGIYLWINNEKILWQRQFNLDSLIAYKRQFYPRIKPATAKNRIKEDSRFGDWATPLNPIDMAFHCNQAHTHADADLEDITIAGLPKIETALKSCTPLRYHTYKGLNFPLSVVQEKNKEMTHFFDHMSMYKHCIQLDQKKIRSDFIATLGPRCQYKGPYIDINRLPPIERSLWVIFLACCAQKKEFTESIETLLDQFGDEFDGTNLLSGRPNMNLNGVTQLYKKVIKNTKVKLVMVRIAKQHGYYYTAFTELYRLTNDRYGKIIARDFQFLKEANRLLYLSLSQVGLPSARPETAAIRNHYIYEKQHTKAIATPQVDSAVLSRVHEIEEDLWTKERCTKSDRFGAPSWIKEKQTD